MQRVTKTVTGLMFVPAALLMSASAWADDYGRPSYNYLDVSYIYAENQVKSTSIRPGAEEYDFHYPLGIKLAGSAVLYDQILLRGSFYGGDGEWKDSADAGASSLTAAVGWLAPTTDATGIDVSLEYRRDKLTFVDQVNPIKWEETIDGPGISFGVRSRPTENTEFGVRAGWYEGDFGGAIGFGMEIGWNAGENWGLRLTWDRMDADVRSSGLDSYELNQYGFLGRFYF